LPGGRSGVKKMSGVLMQQHPVFCNASSKATAFISLILVLLAFTSGTILMRLSEEEISPIATVFDRVLIGTLIFGFVNGLGATVFPPSDDRPVQAENTFSRDFWLLLAIAILFITFQNLWSWSLTQTTVAISNLLMSMKPLFTCLFAWIIWRQQFEQKFIIGMIIVIVGASAIGIEDMQIATGKVRGDLAALLAAFLEAVYMLIVEKLRSKLNATTILLWCCSLGTIFSFPILLFTQDRLFPVSVRGWVFVISLTIIGQVLGHGLLAYSLKKLSSGFVALVLLLQPVLTAIASWGVFGERLSLFDWVAFFLIMLGLYLAVSSQSTKTNSI